MKILGLIAGAAMLLGAHSAYAVTVTINNGSFETGIAPGNFTTLAPGDNTSITGWTVGGAGIDYIGTHWLASDGAKSLDMSALGAGSISQDINNLHVGQEYTISFDIAGNFNAPPVSKSLAISVGPNPTDQGLATFDTTGATSNNMGWFTTTFVFIATATTQTLTFLSLDNTAGGPALDNVTIAATPIPGALLLFGSALGGMGFLGFRRKKQAAEA